MAVALLDRVGIPRAKERMRPYPHELSGGMRQRVRIAAALILKPTVLLADEPTTALDVTTQASIVELVRELRSEMGMSVVWISHDLAVVGQIADKVAVMYAGEIVEHGSTSDLFARPNHPYTKGLIRSATRAEPGAAVRLIGGLVAEPGRWPAGCRFQPAVRASLQLVPQRPDLRPYGVTRRSMRAPSRRGSPMKRRAGSPTIDSVTKVFRFQGRPRPHGIGRGLLQRHERRDPRHRRRER